MIQSVHNQNQLLTNIRLQYSNQLHTKKNDCISAASGSVTDIRSPVTSSLQDDMHRLRRLLSFRIWTNSVKRQLQIYPTFPTPILHSHQNISPLLLALPEIQVVISSTS